MPLTPSSVLWYWLNAGNVKVKGYRSCDSVIVPDSVVSVSMVAESVVLVILSQPNAYHTQRAQLFRQHVVDQAEALHTVSQLWISVVYC